MNLGTYLSSMGRGGDTMVAHINPTEAMILKMLGGRGSINPRTGLREFDGGGGDNWNVPAPAFQAAAQPTFTAPSGFQPAGAYNGGSTDPNPYSGALYSSYGTGQPIPANASPIDPSLFNQVSDQMSSLGSSGGGVNPFLISQPQWIATPDNPNFSIGSNGYATFTPQGQAAYDAYVQQQSQKIALNNAGIHKGLAGFLGTPLGGLSMLTLPLAIGGGVAALGGAGAAAFGGDATLGAIGGGFDLGAGGLGVPAGEIAANTVADATAGFGGLADAAGVAGAAGGLGGTIGLGGDTAASLGLDLTDPFALNSASPLFVGATDATGDLGLGAGGGISSGPIADATIGGGDLFGGGIAPTSAASFGEGGLDLGAGGYGVDSGLIADNTLGAGDWWENLLDKAGNFISNNPFRTLGLAASGIGLANDLFSQKSNTLDQGQLEQTLQNAAKTLQSGQANPQANAALQGILSQISNGGPNPAATAALQSQAANLNSQGQKLASYLDSGNLPAGVQQSIDQATKQAEAAIKSRYASMGISGSSAEAQDLANARQTAVTQGATIATQLLQQGVSEQNLAAQLYGQLFNQSASQQQLAAQLNESMISNAIQQTGMSNQLFAELLNLSTQQNAQLGQAITNFAASLANTGRPVIQLGAASA